MKTCKPILTFALVLSALIGSGQRYHEFLDEYHYVKDIVNIPGRKTNDYAGIQGSPYLNSDFSQGIVVLKDSSAAKLPLRYNIYANDMEYILNDNALAIGNPSALKFIILENAMFIYLSYPETRGYFEVLSDGKCQLLLKRNVEFQPQEGPKPIEGTIKPAQFRRLQDSYYIGLKGSEPVQIRGTKTLLNVMQDQRATMENYINSEKLKRASKENLIKIVDHYNAL